MSRHLTLFFLFLYIPQAHAQFFTGHFHVTSVNCPTTFTHASLQRDFQDWDTFSVFLIHHKTHQSDFSLAIFDDEALSTQRSRIEGGQYYWDLKSNNPRSIAQKNDTLIYRVGPNCKHHLKRAVP